jgi:integrase
MLTTTGKRISVYLNSPPIDRPHYQMQWIDPDTGGRRTQTAGTADEGDAERARADKEYELNNGIDRRPGRDKAGVGAMAWSEFRTLYEQQKLSSLSKQTRQLNRVAFNRFEASQKLAALARASTEDAVARWRVSMEGEDLSPVTIVGNMALLRAALRWAAKRKLIAAPPNFDMPRIPDQGPPQRILDADGYADLRVKIPGEWRPFLDVGWYTGMRRAEILTLSWSPDADGPNLTADLSRIEFPAATSKNRRYAWIPVHTKLRDILSASRGRTGKVMPPNLAPQGHASGRFRKACLAAGYDLKPHDLRRSFASRYAPLIQAADLQRLMRHASIATTMKFYVNVDRSVEAAIHRA